VHVAWVILIRNDVTQITQLRNTNTNTFLALPVLNAISSINVVMNILEQGNWVFQDLPFHINLFATGKKR
jgi:uncharacterized membrane protein